MASLVTCCVAGVSWCFCSALASLFESCCGNDKPSTVPPGAHSGRKRSVALLVLAIAIAFAFQYGIAAAITDFSFSNYVTEAWLDRCEDYDDEALVERCAGNAGVYRSAGAATLFFVLAAVAVLLKPSANREAWPAKYILFCFLVVVMCLIPNDPLFLKVYLNIARVGAVFFILLEQVILVDIAYCWNDSWVEKSDKAEKEEIGSGRKWLAAIIFSALLMFSVSIAGWALIIRYFAGCDTNNAFIGVTIGMCVLITVAQYVVGEGSLLSSSVVCIYATSLLYSAVAKNPDGECNPFLGEDDILGIIIGVGFTVISLSYTGWSMTADRTLNRSGSEILSVDDDQVQEPKQEDVPNGGDRKVSGLVTSYGAADDAEQPSTPQTDNSSEDVPNTFNNSWRLNVCLACVSCWFAMALTGWGSIESGGSVANPTVGRVGMWMIIASQWFVLALYLWTLVAPRLFPDRDFS